MIAQESLYCITNRARPRFLNGGNAIGCVSFSFQSKYCFKLTYKVVGELAVVVWVGFVLPTSALTISFRYI